MTELVQPGLAAKTTFTPGELAELRALAGEVEQSDGLDLRIVWDALEQRAGDLANDFVYHAEGRVVGFLMLSGLGDDEAEATGMVHPAYRRRGIFRELVGAARAACTQHGTASLLFTPDHQSEAARGFIESIGARFQFAEQRMRLDAAVVPSAPSGDLAIAPASAADAAQIATIFAADTGGDPAAFTAHIVANAQQPGFQYYLARRGDMVVGTANMQILNGDAYVYGFVVHPEQRGRGYGRQILAKIIDMSRAAGPRPIFLEVETENAPALALYRSFGFQATHTFDYYQLGLEV